ncbi:MAG TPA: cyclase family protein [Herpetosiphonaceae bacterium]|nr:cyclase family protein [Herpetosiphonaceae bacterium]
MPTIYDVTVPLKAGLPVWDGDPPTIVDQVVSIKEGGPYNLSRLALSAHAGTHVDAPRHFLASGQGIDTAPLEVLIGPCLLWAPPGAGPITARMLHELPDDVDRLLIKTGTRRWWEDEPPALPSDWRALTAEATHVLLRRGLRLAGTDAPSIDAPEATNFPVHHALLGGGMIVVEALDLSLVAPGACELICLPLRVVGADGAPARVVLLKEQ